MRPVRSFGNTLGILPRTGLTSWTGCTPVSRALRTTGFYLTSFMTVRLVKEPYLPACSAPGNQWWWQRPSHTCNAHGEGSDFHLFDAFPSSTSRLKQVSVFECGLLSGKRLAIFVCPLVCPHIFERQTCGMCRRRICSHYFRTPFWAVSKRALCFRTRSSVLHTNFTGARLLFPFLFLLPSLPWLLRHTL